MSEKKSKSHSKKNKEEKNEILDEDEIQEIENSPLEIMKDAIKEAKEKGISNICNFQSQNSNTIPHISAKKKKDDDEVLISSINPNATKHQSGNKSSKKEKEKEKEKEAENSIQAKSNAYSQQNIDCFADLENFVYFLDSWKEPLQGFINGGNMKHIFEFVKREYSSTQCYPPKNEIFNAFKFTVWNDVKVVILGQDPYFNHGEAMGLCFSVNRGVKVPPSLKNIYKALVKEGLMTSEPSHGDLSSWAKQGVLMINATMTVRAKKANSHQKESKWETFTDYVIKTIDSKQKGVVFLLWGSFAQKKKKLITSGNSHVIENLHPSPLAATKGDFSALKQFTMVNDYLKKAGKNEINWNIPK